MSSRIFHISKKPKRFKKTRSEWRPLSENKQTVKFVYPQSFHDISVVQEIRLEIGPLAAWTPTETVKITYLSSKIKKKPPSGNIPKAAFWR